MMSAPAKAVVVTPNPAIDTTYVIPGVRLGEVNRVASVQHRPGGKGLNVAGVLGQLGVPALATGFLGGAGGRRMRELLADAPFEHTWVETAGDTRTTVAVRDGDAVTMLNEAGTPVTGADWQALTAVVTAAIAPGDVLVVSGSFPPGTSADAVIALLQAGRAAGAMTILDTSGPLLQAAAPYSDILKPNREELLAATGAASVVEGAEILLAQTAGAVFVSAGEDGMELFAATPDGVRSWLARPAEVVFGNPTGAGDAAVAAIAAHVLAHPGEADLSAALPSAVSLSAAAVLVPVAGRVDLDAYHRFLPNVPLESTHATR